MKHARLVAPPLLVAFALLGCARHDSAGSTGAQAGLDAVDTFLAAFNSRDPEAFAATLNYPHVRNGESVWATAEEFAAGRDFEALAATGWDHSVWDLKRVVHASDSRAHVAIGGVTVVPLSSVPWCGNWRDRSQS